MVLKVRKLLRLPAVALVAGALILGSGLMSANAVTPAPDAPSVPSVSG